MPRFVKPMMPPADPKPANDLTSPILSSEAVHVATSPADRLDEVAPADPHPIATKASESAPIASATRAE